MHQRRITYLVEGESGAVYSRVGDEVAIPVLLWDKMTPANCFEPSYRLEKFKVLVVADSLVNLLRTRKIPVEIKNIHRRFWGMRPL